MQADGVKMAYERRKKSHAAQIQLATCDSSVA
jgi:hypothetical protein